MPLTRRERQSAAKTSRRTGTPVHMYYQGNRVEGLFHLELGCITIVGGQLDGEVFTSPRAAACAVIRLFNPDIEPSMNGWKHWLINKNSSPIDTLRKEQQ